MSNVKSKKKVTPAKKVSNKAKKQVQDSTEAVIAKNITDKKELKYVYPKGCNTLALRKSFRRKARATIKRLNDQIEKIRSGKIKGKIKEVQAELEVFQKQILVNP